MGLAYMIALSDMRVSLLGLALHGFDPYSRGDPKAVNNTNFALTCPSVRIIEFFTKICSVKLNYICENGAKIKRQT